MSMEDEEEEDEEEDSGEEEEEEEEEEVRAFRIFPPVASNASFYLYPIYFYSQEDDHTEIDPSAILPPGTRRSARGAKVDYASAEALAKAGLKPETANEDEDDDDDSMSHD